ncbi:MAG: peptidase S10, partial [Acetobacteraceae bacterium]|nr:peptidase S10 [Acetobacteraceae bacterium]
HRRWASPRFLCGESYGTTRAVSVAGKMAGGLAGVAFNGIALISMILDFHTARFERGNAVPDVCFLPTYAMTALHHGKIEPKPADRGAWLDDIRRFAQQTYLPALFAGNRLGDAEVAAIAEQLAGYTGLPAAWLRRTRLRIDAGRFRKELLRDSGRTVGRFDGRYTGIDYDAVGELPDADPSSYAIDSAYVTAMNDHLTRQLGVDWDRTYVPFNREIGTKWDWTGPKKEGAPRWPGYVNVAPMLGTLQRENPRLRVLVANGLYDMATPFFAAETTVAGNGIDASRVRMTYYEAGHMMYLHEPSFAALVQDLRGLIAG